MQQQCPQGYVLQPNFDTKKSRKSIKMRKYPSSNNHSVCDDLLLEFSPYIAYPCSKGWYT